MLCSLFCTNWWSCKEDGKEYYIDVFHDLLIRDQQLFLDKGKLGGKQKFHFLNGKGKHIYKDRGCTGGSSP